MNVEPDGIREPGSDGTVGLRDAIAGCLLGTATGDSVGLPMEGLSPRRAGRIFRGPMRQRLIGGCGMISDDTEHACMTAEALILAAGDADEFTRRLAWKLRWWLARLPAGVGLATLRAILKLWIGFPPGRAGVRSAGNGPAMRAPILGVVCARDDERLRLLVRGSTRLTHTDPRAETGALVVARAAALAAARADLSDAAAVVDGLLRFAGADPAGMLAVGLRAAGESVRRGESTTDFARGQGWESGVTGFIDHTVPAVIHAWLRSPGDMRQALEGLIRCGGDTDSTGAILGGIAGAGVGAAGVPADWLDAICDRPVSVAWMNSLADSLARFVANPGGGTRPPRLAVWLIPLRNTLFLAVVLLHGLRRLLPPY